MNPADISRLAALNKRLAERGDRDARRKLSEMQVKAAHRTASPAGLLALFPALKRKT